MTSFFQPCPKPLRKPKQPRPLARKSRINPVNKARRHERFERAYHSVGFVQWIHSLGCSVDGCRETDIEACHVVARPAGTWRDVVPMCRVHHSMQHTLGIRSFERRFNIELSLVASAVAQRWDAFIKEQGQ